MMLSASKLQLLQASCSRLKDLLSSGLPRNETVSF